MFTNNTEIIIQVLLPILALTLSFSAMYCNANVILALYGENASKYQKALFAFIAGPLLSVFPLYLLNFLGELDITDKIGSILFLLWRNTNPFFALLYCYVGIRIMHLSPLRSLRLINITCLCMTVIRNLNLLIGATFFEHTFFNYDIYKDFIQQVTFLATTVVIYFVASKLVKRLNTIKIADSPFTNQKNEIILFFARSSTVYFFAVALPLCISNQIIAYSLVLVISVLIIIVCIQGDLQRANKIELENKTAHITALNTSTENFRSIKHDFSNILHTYGGYIAIGNLEALHEYHSKFVGMTTSAGNAMELSKRMNENPSLFSLLVNKSAYAEKLNVRLDFALPPKTPHFYIEMIDLCRAIGCLLDNAIEAAAESAVKEVQFTVTEKAQASILIIILNNTKGAVDTSEIMKIGVSGKEGHTGIGLSTVRKVLSKYANCGFQISYYDSEFCAYIELKPPSDCKTIGCS